MPNFQPGPHLRRPGKSEKPSGMGSVLQCVDCQSMSKHVDTNISVGFATPNLSTNTGTSKIVKHGRVKMRINKSKNLQKRETRGNKKRNRGTHKNRYSWYARNRKHENKQWDNKNSFQKSKRLRICRPQSRTRNCFKTLRGVGPCTFQNCGFTQYFEAPEFQSTRQSKYCVGLCKARFAESALYGCTCRGILPVH